MRDVLLDPCWKPDDLGCPLPDSPHAVSVAMPRWNDVIGYEERRPNILERLACGYPRFVLHPAVEKLRTQAATTLREPVEAVLLFPSTPVARRAARFIQRATGKNSRIEPWDHALAAVISPSPEARSAALRYWRFSGEIISSRQATALLGGHTKSRTDSNNAPSAKIRERLSTQTGCPAADIFLLPSGMAAFATAHRLAAAIHPDRTAIQLDFPYVDALKVQQHFGTTSRLITSREADTPGALESLVASSSAGAVFCEIASNPQLHTIDLPAVSRACRTFGIPVIADDTIASHVNVDLHAHADLVTTSLTKFFSGAGDVMAGALFLNPASPFYHQFREGLDAEPTMPLFHEDAAVLEANSRDYPDRMRRINDAAEEVAEWLRQDPRIAHVAYPKFIARKNYEALLRKGGGYGGLLSIDLPQPARQAPRFYDALRLNKGPSLGTNFTLVCPYMLLAHYDELDWCETCGIDRHLIRLSIGLEPPGQIIEALDRALSDCS